MPGYLNTPDLIDLQMAANTFVLPSSKEGFGLVFIEAQAAGLRVLAGNKDGSKDAVTHHLAGKLINPSDLKALENALLNFMQKPSSEEEKLTIQHHCKNNFSYSQFAQQLESLVF